MKSRKMILMNLLLGQSDTTAMELACNGDADMRKD